MAAFWQLAGIVLGVAGIAVLRAASQRKARHWPLVSAGWALILGSLAAWGETSGVDKGPALGIVALTLIALGAVGLSALGTPVKQRREARIRTAPAAAAEAAARPAIGPAAARVLAIVFAGLIVTIAACTALFMGARALGMEHTANLTLAMFAFPLGWAGLATWIGFADNLRRRAGVLLAILALAGVIVIAASKGN